MITVHYSKKDLRCECNHNWKEDAARAKTRDASVVCPNEPLCEKCGYYPWLYIAEGDISYKEEK